MRYKKMITAVIKKRLRRYSLSLVSVFILLSSFFWVCSDDFLLSRASSDYFPMDVGRSWTYVSDGDSLYREVVGEGFHYERFATIIQRNFLSEYWVKEKSEVRKFVVFDTSLLGERDTIEMGYKLYYRFPLVNNSGWEENILDTVVIASDSFAHIYTFSALPLLIDTIRTPAGSFFNVYKIEFSLIRDLISLRDTTTRYEIKSSWVEFLAPQVGVVRREEGGRTEVLTSFKR